MSIPASRTLENVSEDAVITNKKTPALEKITMQGPDDSPASAGFTALDPGQDLRDRAEVRRRTPEGRLETLSSAEIRRTLHELRVRQTEIEIQNEELRRAQEELDAISARYFNLYDLAPAGYRTVGENGLILETESDRRRHAGCGSGSADRHADFPVDPRRLPGHLLPAPPTTP